MNQRQVSFLNFPALKYLAQLRMGNIIFRDQQEAGRFLIEPVYDARPPFATHIRQILKVKHEGVGNRTRARAGPRVDH